MEVIYVLKLKNGKYYIGKTQNIEKRINDHFSGNGSAWTKRFKPVSLVEKFDVKSKYDEDNTTKTYMQKYGIKNVRGGSYTTIVLANSIMGILIKEFASAKNKCFVRGDNCQLNDDSDWTTDDDPDWTSDDADEKFPVGSCFRCGRKSHYAYNCYAKTDIHGNKI